MKNLVKAIVLGLSVLYVLGRIAVLKNANSSASKAGPAIQINENYLPQFAKSYNYRMDCDTIVYRWTVNFDDPKNEKGYVLVTKAADETYLDTLRFFNQQTYDQNLHLHFNRNNIACHPCYCELVAFLGEGDKALVLTKELSVRRDSFNGKPSLTYEIEEFVISNQ